MSMSNWFRVRTGKNVSSTNFAAKQWRAFRPRLEALEDRRTPATISISDAAPVVEGPALLNTLDPGGAATVGLNGPRNIAFNDIAGHMHYGDLFVTSYVTHSVLRFDWETQTYHPFVTPNSGGLGESFAAVFGPDGNLYVTALDQDTVLRYDGTDGHFLDVFVTSGSGGLKNASGLTFGSDGNLYVCSSQSDQVLRYQGPNGLQPGQFIGVFANTGVGSVPDELVFGPDGNLYVSCPQFDTPTPFDGVINRYQGPGGASPGQFIDTFVPTGSGGQTVGRSPVFDAQGRLYIADAELNAVLRYQGPNDPSPGTFIDARITSAAGGLDTPIGLAIGRDGAVYVADRDLDKVAGFHTPQARFVVTLDAASATEISVTYSTSSATALTDSDFVSTSGTLTFKPGETSKTILVKTNDDSTNEPVETFTVNLSNVNGATIADGQASGTIQDNDPKFYVVNDAASDQVYRYGPTGASQATTALGAGNTAPRGAASNVAGDRQWIADANKNVYVYNPAGSLLGSWTAGSLASNAQVEGIATNGTDIWIVDARQDRVFKYAGAASLLSGSQNATGSFNLASGNNNPKGIVTDGTSIWVVNDASTDKVFKYTMAGALLGSWTITGGGGAPTGITLDPTGPTQLWIVDSATDRVYEFAGALGRVSGSQSPSASFALAPGNTNPQDIADPPGATNASAVTSTTLTSISLNPASPRSALTFTATVIGGSDGDIVELHDNSSDGAVVATGVLTGGSATLTIPANTLSAGTHELVAVYPGDGLKAPSVSDPILQVIDARPSIVSIAPFSGPTTGGTIVVITGTNFDGATAVAFGPNSATSFTVNSSTQITATAPAAAGVGVVDIVVTTPDGSSTTTGTADDFTYVLPAPKFGSLVANGGEMYAVNAYGVKVAGLAGNHSIIEQLFVSFDIGVTLDPGAFTLDAGLVAVNTAGGVTPVPQGTNVVGIIAEPDPNSLDANGGYKSYRLRFSGSSTYLNSFDNSAAGNGGLGNSFTTLKDGFYSLTINGANVHAGDSIAGTPMAGNASQNFWTMYASVAADDRSVSTTPGDGSSAIGVNSSLIDFAKTNGDGHGGGNLADYNANFDWNLDGDVGNDLIEFTKRFGAEWRF